MGSAINGTSDTGNPQDDGILDRTPASVQRTWLWQPNLIVFVSSACIMILELVAGRIIAPYVGVSLYTWTSIIGVVLAGISLGNYLGGRLADRWASLRMLGVIFVLGGLASFGALTVDTIGRLATFDWPIVLEILVLTTALFFVPCLILGTISPVVAKLAVHDLSQTGSTVGKIYAAGTAGSIVGTFATGFLLISWFGTHTIVWGVALVLLTLGFLLLLTGYRRFLLLVALILIGGTMFAMGRGWLTGPCTRETNYFCVRVREDERDGEPVRVLTLDRMVHSYNSLDDPTRLVYDYEKIYAEVAGLRSQEERHLRALFVGGGGYTFPRYMEAVYPESEIDVIEIDPGVTQVAYDMLGLNLDTRILTFNEDARLFLEREPVAEYDLIFGDAFNDFSVPYHLTTREFNDRVRAWLADDGLYVVNMIDGPRREFLRAYAHTLRQTFRHVRLIPTIEQWRQSPRVTFVLVASDTALNQGALQAMRSDDGETLLERKMLSEDEADALLEEGSVVTLTDRYAPVDQLLASVFREEAPR